MISYSNVSTTQLTLNIYIPVQFESKDKYSKAALYWSWGIWPEQSM